MKTTMTQKELAQRLGVSRGYLSEILAGKKRFPAETALRLEKATLIDVRVWLYGTALQIRRLLEQSFGCKINFARGRPNIRQETTKAKAITKRQNQNKKENSTCKKPV